ncbi:MAG: pyridoxamine 5'-phosphate oxidase family protein [Verrucomicrobiae bacterium]|nr:pyridoxamine 5'-phosphate oxidase family protein [Verrucomicrobiae bacterium]
MGSALEEITPDLQAWIAEQKVFFVATAPLSADGHINLSPKGGDSFRVLGPRRVAYLDLTGSGAETIAHLRENGRIVVMFCAFSGPPKILRLHGRGEVVREGHAEFAALHALFPPTPGSRSVIRIEVDRVGNSCGFAVPEYVFRRHRDTLDTWAAKQGPHGIAAYQSRKNARSLDGLPALDPPPENPAEKSAEGFGTRAAL